MPKQQTSGQVPMYSQPYNNTYHSIAGVDIKAVLAGVTFANLQAISYSITREKAPIYTMGSVSCRGYARGKRGIAGSMVFVMFDSHAVLEAFRALTEDDEKYQFVSDNDESRPQLYTPKGNNISSGGQLSQSIINRDIAAAAQSGDVIATQAVSLNIEQPFDGNLDKGWSRTAPWYADQIPPFNTVLVGVNEMGYAVTMSFLGCEFLNEGYGISIDDLVSEKQMTYVCREIAPWQRVTGAKFQQSLGNKWRVPFSK